MLAENRPTMRSPKNGNAIVHVQDSPQYIAQQWLANLEKALTAKDLCRLGNIMHDDCWWRDMLTFDWDLRTIQGLDKLKTYFEKHLARTGIGNFCLRNTGKYIPSIQKPTDEWEWIQSMFDFETKIGRGTGMLRLSRGLNGIWKGHMIYTALKELNGFEEKIGPNRAHGGNNSPLNWQELRARQLEFLDQEPAVLIIGAGKQRSLSHMCRC